MAAAVAGGGATPFERAHGLPIFEYMGTNSRLSALFDKAMAKQSMIVVNKLLDHSEVFDGVRVLVDVGGGDGSTLGMITSRYKHIKGINFDLPHVISEAPPRPGNICCFLLVLIETDSNLGETEKKISYELW